MDTIYKLIQHLRVVEADYRFLKMHQKPFDLMDYPALIRRAQTLLDHRGQWRIPLIERVERAGFIICRCSSSSLLVMLDGDPIKIPLTTEVYEFPEYKPISLTPLPWWSSLDTLNQPN